MPVASVHLPTSISTTGSSTKAITGPRASEDIETVGADSEEYVE